MDYQDWKTNYIIGKGKFVQTDASKVTVAPKVVHKGTGKAPHLVDDDIMSVQKVDHDLKMAIQQGRNAKGWTQQELALRLCVKPTIINTYENGTAIPDNAFIAKIENVLGCKLPRAPKKK